MTENKLLNVLSAQIRQLEHNIAQTTYRPSQENRFDPQLFAFAPDDTRSYLSTYLIEVKHHFKMLCAAVQKNQLEHVHFLSDKIVAQISALSREIATQELRPHEAPVASSSTAAETRERYTNYFRRLTTMKTAEEEKLTHAKTHDAKQQHQQAIAVLEGRLYRCQSALRKLH